jgi:hypothetical protein
VPGSDVSVVAQSLCRCTQRPRRPVVSRDRWSILRALLKRQNIHQISCGVAALLLSSTMACALAPPRVPVSDVTRAEYEQRCALCHGDSGDGRGPQATSLPVPIANWSDSAWQAKVTDDQLRQTILGGGAAAGKSSAMPPNPDLEGTPTLEEIVALIRGFER